MILRRVLEHVRAQNWAAVGIDLVIVVVGVFIGIQLGNWNEDLRDRRTETLYLERLAQELAEMALQAEAAQQSLQARLDLIIETRESLASASPGASLTAAHCAALGRSHIFAGVIFYPPTIKELIATGRIVLIRDDALRTRILAFDQAYESISQLRTDVQIDRLPLARRHPELMRNGFSEWEESECAFEAMATDRSFLNDFVDNTRRYGAYVSEVGGRQAELLQALHGEVVARLN